MLRLFISIMVSVILLLPINHSYAYTNRELIDQSAKGSLYWYLDSVRLTTSPHVVKVLTFYDNNRGLQMEAWELINVNTKEHQTTEIKTISTPMGNQFRLHSGDGILDSNWTDIITDSNFDELYRRVVEYVNNHQQELQYYKEMHKLVVSITPSDQVPIQKPIQLKPIPAPKKYVGWSSTWKTIFGEMILNQKNSQIIGTVNGKQFTGIISGNECTGKWTNMKMFNSLEQEGEFKFILSDNADYFKIMWRDKDINIWVTEPIATRIDL